MDDIAWAYDSITSSQPSLSWMLLHYPSHTGTVQDELRLHSYGPGSVSEMKAKMVDAGLEHVFVAFYREQEDESRKRRCILINYLPVGLTGVRRARAMVHSRRMSASLTAAMTTLTVDHISNLTSSAIFKALSDPDANHVITTHAQSPEDAEPVPEAPTPLSQIPLPKSSYPSYASPSPTSSPQGTPNQKSSSMFSGLLKKVKAPPLPQPPQSQPTPPPPDDPVFVERYPSPPPPPPPKEASKPRARPLPLPVPAPEFRPQHAPSPSVDSFQIPRKPPPSPGRDRSQSLSEFAVISRHPNGSGELTVHDVSSRALTPGQVHKSRTLPTHRANFVVPLPNKWSSVPVSTAASPEVRARLRAQAKAEKEAEEQRVLEEERERQLRIKELKEQAAEEALYEEQRRKAAVEAEVRRVMTLRREKQEREREEEQRRIDELRAKKEAERKRKEAEHQRLEQWRKEREQEVKEEQKRKEEQRKQEAIFLKRRVLSTAAEIKDFVKKGDKAKESKWFSGEVSIQKSGGDNLIWRRRYWKIVGQVMLLYKSAKDTNLILHTVDLRNDIKAAKEWHEGYEELEAIPHSFALEFKDRTKDTWAMYADSEADKIRILALLNYLGGL